MEKFKTGVIIALSSTLAYVLGACTMSIVVLTAVNETEKELRKRRSGRVSYQRYYDEET